MLKIKSAAWTMTVLAAVVFAGVPSKAHGIPYFARKYRTTCSRCHSDVPKLNTFGKNFQLHGYQQPGDKPVNKIDFPEDKNLTLIDQLPIGFLIENQLQADKTVGNSNVDNIASPWVFHIFAADSIAPDMSFFGELATTNGVMGVGKTSLIFSHLTGQNLFLEIGNIDPTEHGVTEHDLFGRGGYAVQDLGLAATGGYVLSAQHMGVRAYGLFGASVTPDLIHGKTTGTDQTTTPAKSDSHGPLAMATDSKQKGNKSDEDEAEAPDPMDQLHGFLWEIGAYNSTNTNMLPTTPNPSPSDLQGRINMYFSGDSFIGFAGYSGLMTVGGGEANHYTMLGPDLSYYFGKPIEKVKGMKVKPFNLLAGYLAGDASNPAATGQSASWHGYYAELDYMTTNRSVAFVRYDKVNGNNLDLLEPTYTEALTLNYTYYPRTNFWIGLEYTHDMTAANQNLLGLLFNFGF